MRWFFVFGGLIFAVGLAGVAMPGLEGSLDEMGRGDLTPDTNDRRGIRPDIGERYIHSRERSWAS